MEIRKSLATDFLKKYRKDRQIAIFSSLAALLFVVATASLFYDLTPFTGDASFREICLLFWSQPDSTLRIVLLELRLPRLLMAILVGAGLALGGCLMQAIFKNPLATPSLVGVSSGASLFAALMIVGDQYLRQLSPLLASPFNVPLAAFGGALLVCSIVYRFSHVGGRTSIALLLMSGVAINAIAGAMTGFLVYLANDNQLRSITFWTLGSLGGSDWTGVFLMSPLLLIAAIALPFTYRSLNALSAGDDLARHIGIDAERVKKLVLVYVSLCVGISVAFCGLIGFIGLMVPHIGRMLFGAHHKPVLISCFLLGPIILVGADFLSRHLAAPAEIPIGILTSALGGPFFLYLLNQMRRGRGVL